MFDHFEWDVSYRAESEPESYRAEFHGWDCRVERDDEFHAWTWIVKDLETGVLLDSGMSRYDGEAVKQAERAVRYRELGVRTNGY